MALSNSEVAQKIAAFLKKYFSYNSYQMIKALK